MGGFLLINIETMVNYFSQIRKYYASHLIQHLKDEGLSSNEISMLILLSNNASITTSAQLSVLLGVSKGLVSRSVDHLVNKGLLVTNRDQKDRRVLHLYLSEKGKSFVENRLKNEVETINQQLFGNISVEEITQMEKTMAKIIDCFKQKEEY